MTTGKVRRRNFSFRSKVWLYPGAGGWYFITMPQDQSDIISGLYGWGRRGFGSIRVEVTVGKTTWRTSIFPDKKAGAYILPLKAEVRKKENIKNNSLISVALSLLM